MASNLVVHSSSALLPAALLRYLFASLRGALVFSIVAALIRELMSYCTVGSYLASLPHCLVAWLPCCVVRPFACLVASLFYCLVASFA